MARPSQHFSMEVISVLMHKDFAALGRIDEMRQNEIAKHQPRRNECNKRPRLKEGLPTQITQHYKDEPYREVTVLIKEVSG